MSSRRVVVGGILAAAGTLVTPVVARPPTGKRHWVPHQALSGAEPAAHFYFGEMDNQPQGWTAHNCGNAYACQSSPDDRVLRLELHAGDQWQIDVQQSPKCERSMVQAGYAQAARLPLSTDVWWAFSFFVENGPPISAPGPGYDWTIIADVHSDYNASHAPSIPIQFELHTGDILAIQTHGDFLRANVQHFVYKSGAPLARGVWHDMVMRINMDPVNASGRGGAEVWLDRTKIYDYAGPLGFANDLPYIQFQIYRNSPDPKSTTREAVAIRYANHRIVTMGNLSHRTTKSPPFPKELAG